MAMLTTGALAPFFWIEVLGCAATAVIAFTPKLRTNPLIVVASLLAIVGIFCKRVQLLVGGFQIPNLDYAGPMTQYTVTDWATGMTGAYQGMVYWPTPMEFGIVLGRLRAGGVDAPRGPQVPAPQADRALALACQTGIRRPGSPLLRLRKVSHGSEIPHNARGVRRCRSLRVRGRNRRRSRDRHPSRRG